MTLEEALDRILELEDKVKSATEENAGLKTAKAELETRVSSLQEHNQKLFLRCTIKDEPADDKDTERPPSLDDVAALIMKGE
jgi:hypothetical protein